MALQDDLAAPSGSSLIGFQQSSAGSIARTVQDKLQEVVSAEDSGAIANTQGAYSLDSTAQLQASITEAGARRAASIQTERGVFQYSSLTNKAGVEIKRPGFALESPSFSQPDTWRLRHSYADKIDYVVGYEYLLSIPNLLLSTSPMVIDLFGDSTMKGDLAYVAAGYSPANLLTSLALYHGVTAIDVVNNAVDGTKSYDMDVSLIRTNSHAVIIGYGTNDGGLSDASHVPGDALELFYDNIDAKLTAVRAAYPFGSTNHKDIILKGPNSTNVWVDARHQVWCEKIRGVFVELARKHHCLFIDVYAWMQDSTNASNWMDTNIIAGQNTAHIHPNNLGNAKIWGLIADSLFNRGQKYGKGNSVVNRSSAHGINGGALAADGPGNYPFGISLDRTGGAIGATGWPLNGAVVTEKQADSITVQRIFSFNGATPLIAQRTSLSCSAWGPWSTTWNTPTLVNGYTNSPGVPVAYSAKPDGRVALRGGIVAGTLTAMTTIFSVPAGYYPAQPAVICTSTNLVSGGTGYARLVMSTSGNLQIVGYGPSAPNTIDLDNLGWYLAGA